MSGLLTYVVDGAGVPGADLFIVVDGTAYPVTTDADGNWSVTPTVANGLHNVFVALGETVLASTSFTTILPTQNPGDTTNPGDGTTTGGTTTPNQTFTTTTASATPVVNGGVPSANYATQGVLGTSTNTTAPADPANTDPTGAADVKGTSTEKKAADAVDTNNNDGKALGLAWYWWLLIIAGLAALIWWIIAAIRRRRDEEQ